MIEGLNIGDVIVEELPEGYYGCMVVLEVDKKGKECLVMISKYFSLSYPSLEDPEIMESAVDKSGTRDIDYHSWGGHFQQSEKKYRIIGNLDVRGIIPINSPFYGVLTTMSLYYEWLSQERPEEFEKMIQEEEHGHLHPPEYYKYMEEGVFWSIIDKYLKGKDTTEFLVKKLSKLKKKEIIEFHNTFADRVNNLSKLKVYDPSVSYENYLSEDTILYTKCYVIAQGRIYYDKVLSSGTLDLSDDRHDFEELLYVTEEALELRGVQIDYDKLREVE
ncbi:DUF4240 domain-containing protein [Staphylococcus americanisciuri]|uniref:DUF4240 domain-containing protein n=1 Tax=Staphylococcus americanisciuri TaxID=2973940 RepID=A0ABT2F0P4_9STAP|nr:DUF4240 domain-containing protein [Staphylococcus americanisciuri]MCS4485939.1 DUF4240 domain-containing protein [Staphylococcus americanisciuri]